MNCVSLEQKYKALIQLTIEELSSEEGTKKISDEVLIT